MTTRKGTISAQRISRALAETHRRHVYRTEGFTVHGLGNNVVEVYHVNAYGAVQVAGDELAAYGYSLAAAGYAVFVADHERLIIRKKETT